VNNSKYCNLANFKAGRKLGWVVVMGLALSGCATSNTRPTPSAAQNTDAYVSDHMSQTIDSVDQSLKVLVSLSRGDEGPRKPGFIGDTIAGASGPNKTAPAMSYAAGPQTDLGQQQERERLAANRAALQTHVKAVWNGQPGPLLSQISSHINYGFFEAGSGTLPDVHLSQYDATVEDVLADVAGQIKPAGAIKVLVGPRQVCLIRGPADTPCASSASTAMNH
jgi:hypothetical protein